MATEEPDLYEMLDAPGLSMLRTLSVVPSEWLLWLNTPSTSMIWSQAHDWALALARRDTFSYETAGAIVKGLAPILERAWGRTVVQIEPRVLGPKPSAIEIKREGRGRTFKAKDVRATIQVLVDAEPSLSASIDRSLRRLMDGENDENPDVDAFWALQFVLWLAFEGRPERLRKCAWRDCSRIFVDHSPGSIGRFCSNTCRGKSFRAGIK